MHRSPVNSPHKGQWCGALIFSLICVWINGWLNNREAGHLRRYYAHYDVSVMMVLIRSHCVVSANLPPVKTCGEPCWSNSDCRQTNYYRFWGFESVNRLNASCLYEMFWTKSIPYELRTVNFSPNTELPGAPLLTHGNFNPGMDKQSHDQENVG